MESVLRAVAMYLALMLVLRITGKRSLAQVTTFDLILLLVIGEATSQALIGEDFSLTTAMVVITTLLVLERCLDWLTWRSDRVRRWTESTPVLLVSNGRPDRHTLDQHNLTVADVETAGREQHGLASIDEVRWAVLETSGGISVMPWRAVVAPADEVGASGAPGPGRGPDAVPQGG